MAHRCRCALLLHPLLARRFSRAPTPCARSCVSLYKIPPRPAAGGHRSGEWLVADRIFEGRLRAVARGAAVNVRLEEPGGELFAM